MAVRDVDDARLPLTGQSLADELDEIAAILAAMPTWRFSAIRSSSAALDDDGLFRWSRRTLQQKFAGTDGLDEVLRAFDAAGLRSVHVRRWRALTQNGVLTFDGAGAQTVLLPTYSAGGPFSSPGRATQRRDLARPRLRGAGAR